MRICEYCGSTVESNVCPNCGASVATAPQQPAQNFNTQNAGYNTYNMNNAQPDKLPVTARTWFIVLFLLLFWPVGLFFMWKHKRFPMAVRIIITVILAFSFIGTVTSG